MTYIKSETVIIVLNNLLHPMSLYENKKKILIKSRRPNTLNDSNYGGPALHILYYYCHQEGMHSLFVCLSAKTHKTDHPKFTGVVHNNLKSQGILLA